MIEDESKPRLRVELDELSSALSTKDDDSQGPPVASGECLDCNWDEKPLRYGAHDLINNEFWDAKAFILY